MALTAQRTGTTLQLTSRRREHRDAVRRPAKATIWTRNEKPSEVVVIEADRLGARLVVNKFLGAGDSILVSFSSEIGHHRTLNARVAWAEYLPLAGSTVVGVSFFDGFTP